MFQFYSLPILSFSYEIKRCLCILINNSIVKNDKVFNDKENRFLKNVELIPYNLRISTLSDNLYYVCEKVNESIPLHLM